MAESPSRLDFSSTYDANKSASLDMVEACLAIGRHVFGNRSATAQWITGGSYDNLYLLEFQDQPDNAHSVERPGVVLIRVAEPYKADSDLDVESEVATMVYVQERTTIPVPLVYAYCPSSINPAGSPFIVMSVEEGLPLFSEEWEGMSLDVKLQSVRGYADTVSQLSKLCFDSIGSLYFGSEPATFTLGPVCRTFSSKTKCQTFPVYDRGPWRSASAWLKASFEDQIQLIHCEPELAKETPSIVSPDPEDRLQLAKKVLPALIDLVDEYTGGSRYQEPFALTHIDLSAANILCVRSGPDAGKIVAVIDFEGAASTPLWYLGASPEWFSIKGFWDRRDPEETNAFKRAYVDRLRELGHDEEFVRFAEDPQGRAEFAVLAGTTWVNANGMEEWLRSRAQRVG